MSILSKIKNLIDTPGDAAKAAGGILAMAQPKQPRIEGKLLYTGVAPPYSGVRFSPDMVSPGIDANGNPQGLQGVIPSNDNPIQGSQTNPQQNRNPQQLQVLPTGGSLYNPNSFRGVDMPLPTREERWLQYASPRETEIYRNKSLPGFRI